MRFPRSIAALAGIVILPACTHLQGVVERAPGRPLPTAILSVGRPDGIAVYEEHRVDRAGRFDFFLFPTDESNLYVYDGAGDARLTVRRIDKSEMGPHMLIEVPVAKPDADMTPGAP